MTNLRFEKIINHYINSQTPTERSRMNNNETEEVVAISSCSHAYPLKGKADTEEFLKFVDGFEKFKLQITAGKDDNKEKDRQPCCRQDQICNYSDTFFNSGRENVLVLRNCNQCRDYELGICDPSMNSNPVPAAILKAIKIRKLKEEREQKEREKREWKFKEKSLRTVQINAIKNKPEESPRKVGGANFGSCQVCGKETQGDDLCEECSTKIRNVVDSYMDKSGTKSKSKGLIKQGHYRNAPEDESFSVIVLEDQDNNSFLEHLAHALNKSSSDMNELKRTEKRGSKYNLGDDSRVEPGSEEKDSIWSSKTNREVNRQDVPSGCGCSNIYKGSSGAGQEAKLLKKKIIVKNDNCNGSSSCCYGGGNLNQRDRQDGKSPTSLIIDINNSNEHNSYKNNVTDKPVCLKGHKGNNMIGGSPRGKIMMGKVGVPIAIQNNVNEHESETRRYEYKNEAYATGQVNSCDPESCKKKYFSLKDGSLNSSNITSLLAKALQIFIDSYQNYSPVDKSVKQPPTHSDPILQATQQESLSSQPNSTQPFDPRPIQTSGPRLSHFSNQGTKKPRPKYTQRNEPQTIQSYQQPIQQGQSDRPSHAYSKSSRPSQVYSSPLHIHRPSQAREILHPSQSVAPLVSSACQCTPSHSPVSSGNRSKPVSRIRSSKSSNVSASPNGVDIGLSTTGISQRPASITCLGRRGSQKITKSNSRASNLTSTTGLANQKYSKDTSTISMAKLRCSKETSTTSVAKSKVTRRKKGSRGFLKGDELICPCCMAKLRVGKPCRTFSNTFSFGRSGKRQKSCSCCISCGGRSSLPSSSRHGLTEIPRNRAIDSHSKLSGRGWRRSESTRNSGNVEKTGKRNKRTINGQNGRREKEGGSTNISRRLTSLSNGELKTSSSMQSDQYGLNQRFSSNVNLTFHPRHKSCFEYSVNQPYFDTTINDNNNDKHSYQLSRGASYLQEINANQNREKLIPNRIHDDDFGALVGEGTGIHDGVGEYTSKVVSAYGARGGGFPERKVHNRCGGPCATVQKRPNASTILSRRRYKGGESFFDNKIKPYTVKSMRKSGILTPIAHYKPGVLHCPMKYLLASNAARQSLVRTAAGVTTYEKPIESVDAYY